MRVISGRTQLCLLIGDPVAHSLSPLLHNAGYAATGISDRFVYVAAPVTPENLVDAVKGIRALGVRGISVTTPHKETIVPLLDEVDADGEMIGAVNTVVPKEGRLIGTNTDSRGVVGALKEVVSLKGSRVAVLGAGGAAAAAAVGLRRAGAEVTIHNRTLEKAQQLGERLGCAWGALNDIVDLTSFHVIVNATSAGMQNPPKSPLLEKQMGQGVVVCELSYHPLETPLVRIARGKGARVVLGTEVLLHQAARQFELFTGLEAPISEMRRRLKEKVYG